jgi:hypothetical protein
MPKDKIAEALQKRLPEIEKNGKPYVIFGNKTKSCQKNSVQLFYYTPCFLWSFLLP